MTDLEITKLCAEAMKITLRLPKGGEAKEWLIIAESGRIYDPLHDDAQAMALVKHLHLRVAYLIDYISGDYFWYCGDPDGPAAKRSRNADLNRAICECVAKMEKAKAT